MINLDGWMHILFFTFCISKTYIMHRIKLVLFVLQEKNRTLGVKYSHPLYWNLFQKHLLQQEVLQIYIGVTMEEIKGVLLGN